MSTTTVQPGLSSQEKSSTAYQSQWVSIGLSAVLAMYCIMSCIGITWGLPSRTIDKFLFGDSEVWSGEKIYRLAHAEEKLSDARIAATGADVDVNPIDHARKTPVLLTATDEDVAKIYLRYRLYTYQPDEMITMMALAGMRPGSLQLDPRLYQYGGLFIYPVGALIKLCGMLGWIDVRSDIVWYLDHPEEFGKFYIVARAYSAAWGFIGVMIVFALARRLAVSIQALSDEIQRSRFKAQEGEGTKGNVAGLVAALLFALMPVVVCMSHEGKPHLPGAVLMLVAVYLAIRSVPHNRQSPIANRKYFWLMCVCCGAAVGMVLSSWPICVLIPLTALVQYQRSTIDDRKLRIPIQTTLVGALVAIVVYFATNPYVLINCFLNREVLRSNFGNSLAMYEVSRVAEGFVRVLELTGEGTTWPIAIVGTVGWILGLLFFRQSRIFWLIVVPAGAFFLQFVLIGAGKPGEYGRFGIFTNTTLAIGCATVLASRHLIGQSRLLVSLVILLWVSGAGGRYVTDFRRDASAAPSRVGTAQSIMATAGAIIVPVEPAPYACPPLDFARRQVFLASEGALAKIPDPSLRVSMDSRRHQKRISWAAMNFQVRSGEPRTWSPPIEEDSD